MFCGFCCLSMLLLSVGVVVCCCPFCCCVGVFTRGGVGVGLISAGGGCCSVVVEFCGLEDFALTLAEDFPLSTLLGSGLITMLFLS